MSIWTYVNGAMTLSGSVYDVKKTKSGKEKVFIPFLDEAVDLHLPGPSFITTDKSGRSKSGLDFDMVISSLPRCKPIVEKLLATLPQGETGLNYSLWQDPRNVDSGGSLYHKCDEDAFKRKVVEMYKNQEPACPDFWDYARLKKYLHVRCASVDKNNRFGLSITDSIRSCDASEFVGYMEKLINDLAKEGVTLDMIGMTIYDGYSTFQIMQHHYGSRLCYRELDNKTGAVLAEKAYVHTFEDHKRIDKVVITGDWKYSFEDTRKEE